MKLRADIKGLRYYITDTHLQTHTGIYIHSTLSYVYFLLFQSFLEALVLQHPALLHLSERGVSLLTRFISVKRGYSLLSRLGHLKTELDAWLKVIIIVINCIGSDCINNWQ